MATLTQVLIDEAEMSYAIAERLIRRVEDDELSWVPAEGANWMTVGQLLMHCSTFACGRAFRGFVEGEWGPGAEDAGEEAHVPPATKLPSVTSVHEALEMLAEDRRLAIRCIEAAGEDDLLRRRVAAPWGGRRLCLFQQLLHMIAHLAQHKGQLFYYLKLMGKDVDTVDLWGAQV